jgi:NAD(P)-dependent dehydrogenase (short-subunit alcohol dehydrogenase family)
MELHEGQVAVVTGGGSGIGLAMAEAFTRRGLHVVLGDIDDGDLAAAEARLAALGGTVASAHVDVTDAAQVDQLAALTLDRFGRVDVVCNNAGTVGKNMPLWEFELVEWEWILGVDLWGVIHGIRSFVPHLVEQGHGHVVNTASMAALTTVPLNGPYNASKHAVLSISETLSADLQTRAPEVGVTVLCPGPTLTRMMVEGGRSRPAHLMPKEDKGVAPQLNPGTFAASTSAMMSSEQVAEAVITAIHRNQLYLAPHSTAWSRVAPRLERIERDVNAVSIEPAEAVTSAEALKSGSS